jgi:hypothetical protein
MKKLNGPPNARTMKFILKMNPLTELSLLHSFTITQRTIKTTMKIVKLHIPPGKFPLLYSGCNKGNNIIKQNAKYSNNIFLNRLGF